MPSLQVRELPDNIYAELKKTAEKEHRTLAQQAIVTLAKGLNIHLNAKSRRRVVLEKIQRQADVDKDDNLNDPVELIREDRDQ